LEKQKINFLYLFLTLISCLAVLFPILWFGFGSDQGLYSYGAWLWRKFGLIPYLHCFDHNFPGIFLIHYWAQTILGESITGLRFFDLIWQVFTITMLYLISSFLAESPRAGFFSALFYSIFYVQLGPWDTAQRDGFLLLIYLLAFWLVILHQGILSRIFAGIILGFGFLIKPIALILIGIFSIQILTDKKLKWRPGLFFLFSSSLPFLFIILYYYHKSALDYLWEAIFQYSLGSYSTDLFSSSSATMRGIFLVRFLDNNLLMILGGLLVFIFRKKLGVEKKNFILWLLMIFLGVYFGYWVQGKFYFYQQVPVWGILAIFSGIGFSVCLDFISEKWNIQNKQKSISFCFSAILIIVSFALVSPENWKFIAKILPNSPSSGQRFYPFYEICALAGDFLRENTKQQDKIQVWGGEAIINYLAKRQAPSRFPSTLHLIINPGIQNKSLVQIKFARELLKSLENHPPIYFLVETHTHIGFGVSSDKESLIKEFPEIYNFLLQNYYLEYKMGFIEFYRLKSSLKDLPQPPQKPE